MKQSITIINPLIKQHPIILILIFLALAGASCPSATQKGPSYTDFRTGTTALEMSFLDSIPDEIPEGQSFVVSLQLHNKGAANIGGAGGVEDKEEDGDEGYLMLQSDGKVTFVEKNKDYQIDKFTLVGRSSQNPDGQTDIKFYTAKAGKVTLEEYADSEIRATACYMYHTYAVADVCMDTNQYSKPELGTKACDVKEVAVSGGQGGPIAVTKVVPSFRFNDKNKNTVIPVFTITVEKTGSGDIFKHTDDMGRLDVDYGCGILEDVETEKKTEEDKEKLTRWNKVKVYARLSTEENRLDCESKGLAAYKEINKEIAQLEGNSAEITCTASPIPKNRAAYITPLFIHTIYGHALTETTEIRIANSKGDEKKR